MATSKSFRCRHCSKGYKTQIGLRTHEGMVHKNKDQQKERKLRCKTAWKKYYKKYTEGKDVTIVEKRKATIEKYEETKKATARRKKYEKTQNGKKKRQAYQNKLKKERKEEKKRKEQTAVYVMEFEEKLGESEDCFLSTIFI